VDSVISDNATYRQCYKLLNNEVDIRSLQQSYHRRTRGFKIVQLELPSYSMMSLLWLDCIFSSLRRIALLFPASMLVYCVFLFS